MMKLPPIINSLLDIDLYKFSMLKVMLHRHPNLNGTYIFKCRNKDVKFTKEMFEEINEQINHLCTLTFTDEELEYLNSIPYLRGWLIEFLRLWRPLRRYVKTWLYTEDNSDEGELNIEVYGPLFSAMQFEIYLLAIVNEVYFSMKYDYFELVTLLYLFYLA